MPGKFFPVLADGTYLLTSQETNVHPATGIDLASLGAEQGAYIALQTAGSYAAGNGTNQTSLAACFFRGNAPVQTGHWGQDVAVETPRTLHDNLRTDIPEDFIVTREAKVIVRVPAGATNIKFTPTDSYFSDNVSNGLGVLVSFPNKPGPTPTSDPSNVRDGGIDVVDTRSPNRLIVAARGSGLRKPAIPSARTILASPFYSPTDRSTQPQWRGWYKTSGWNPLNSRYRRTSTGHRKHGGWDIFAPRGSKLVASVGPALLEALYEKGGGGFGRIAAMRFRVGKRTYTLIYGHVDQVVDSPKIVAAGEIVALAGCSGNAETENCGTELSSGGFSDHVHIGLYEGLDIKRNHTYPDEILGWKVQTPS